MMQTKIGLTKVVSSENIYMLEREKKQKYGFTLQTKHFSLRQTCDKSALDIMKINGNRF